MSDPTAQMDVWKGDFGREYTDRNALSFEAFENFFKENFGFTRTELNQKFLDSLDRNLRILEVGSNVGNQLLILQRMGFENLYGIELQSHAVELSKQRTKGINLLEGTAFDIPFKDDFFDLVFTSGVLIHIAPKDLIRVFREIYRVTRDYIWGFEYWAERCTEVSYRGHQSLLWKGDYAKLYLEAFSDLVLVKQEKLKYAKDPNVDAMFLLRKKR